MIGWGSTGLHPIGLGLGWNGLHIGLINPGIIGLIIGLIGNIGSIGFGFGLGGVPHHPLGLPTGLWTGGFPQTWGLWCLGILIIH